MPNPLKLDDGKLKLTEDELIPELISLNTIALAKKFLGRYERNARLLIENERASIEAENKKRKEAEKFAAISNDAVAVIENFVFDRFYTAITEIDRIKSLLRILQSQTLAEADDVGKRSVAIIEKAFNQTVFDLYRTQLIKPAENNKNQPGNIFTQNEAKNLAHVADLLNVDYPSKSNAYKSKSKSVCKNEFDQLVTYYKNKEQTLTLPELKRLINLAQFLRVKCVLVDLDLSNLNLSGMDLRNIIFRNVTMNDITIDQFTRFKESKFENITMNDITIQESTSGEPKKFLNTSPKALLNSFKAEYKTLRDEKMVKVRKRFGERAASFIHNYAVEKLTAHNDAVNLLSAMAHKECGGRSSEAWKKLVAFELTPRSEVTESSSITQTTEGVPPGTPRIISVTTSRASFVGGLLSVPPSDDHSVKANVEAVDCGF